MKRHLLLLVICCLCFAAPGMIQAQVPSGYSVTCDDGSGFDNGVEIIINQMRSGFTYTATAVGLNGFDPVLAVLETDSGEGLCSDDDSDAQRYAADLPTSGRVPASNLSAQVTFNQNSNSTFADISLVVGGYGNQTGEFLLILEGMAVTSGDGAGDVFSVNLTPGMVESGVPLSVYMITRGDGQVDPYIYEVDSDLNARADNNGDLIACDDAGNSSLCWGNSVDLSDSSVTIATGTLPGWQYDAMLNLDIAGISLSSDREQNWLNFTMSTSPSVNTEGQYLLVFDIGITEASGSSVDNNGNNGNGNNGNSGTTNAGTGGTESGSNQADPTAVPNNNGSGSATGMSVTCDNGSSFDNGVEIVLYDLPTEVTYTVTAIGLDGFDPVLAVLEAQSGEGFCNDDAEDAADYTADLPSSGEVDASNLSAQVVFTPPKSSDPITASLVVGGYNNQSGEFLLIVEGLSIDSNEPNGDLFQVNATDSMVDSNTPLTVYMIASSEDLDTYLVETDSDGNPLEDNNGNLISCDDSSNDDLCLNGGVDLSDSSVSITGGSLPGWEYDTMLGVPLQGAELNSDRSQNYLTFVANTSPEAEGTGGYVLVVHAGG
jgi:hypothetical protein